jgi:hypothetical protein
LCRMTSLQGKKAVELKLRICPKTSLDLVPPKLRNTQHITPQRTAATRVLSRNTTPAANSQPANRQATSNKQQATSQATSQATTARNKQPSNKQPIDVPGVSLHTTTPATKTVRRPVLIMTSRLSRSIAPLGRAFACPMRSSASGIVGRRSLGTTSSELPQTMRAVQIVDCCDASQLKMNDNVPLPEVKPGHVLVKNAVTGLK